MTGAHESLSNTELSIPQPSLPDASAQNNILFDDLMTILQRASQDPKKCISKTTFLSFPGLTGESREAMDVPIFISENDNRFSADLSRSIDGKNKIDSNKVKTINSTFPAFRSGTSNLLSIAGNLHVEIEKDTNQCLIMANNTERTLSYTTESPDGNASQKRFLMNDVRVFNTTPFLPKSEQKEGNGLQAAQGMTPPDEKGSLQGNSIQTQLLETVPKSPPDHNVLSPLEESEQKRLTVTEDTKKFISKTTFLSFPGLTGESTKALDARLSLSSQVVSGETSGMTDKAVVCDFTNDCISNFITSVQKNFPFTEDLQAISPSQANSEDHINTGSLMNQCMILSEDRDIQILSGKLHPKALPDNGSSSPLKAHVQGNQLIDSSEQNAVTDTQKHFVLKTAQSSIDTVPFIPAKEGEDNTGLQEKFHMISPKILSPILTEEVQSPSAMTSLKSIIASGISSLIEDLVKRESTPEKENRKNQSPDTIIMGAEDISPPIDNKNRGENTPFRVQIPQEPLHADTFVLLKKGDASIEVSLKPEGIGKINIELTLDRGVINAHINASEIIGKEIIERNLHAILSSLINEGLNIGNFSVSLRNKQSEMNDDRKEDLNVSTAIRTVRTPVALSHNNIISIFV